MKVQHTIRKITNRFTREFISLKQMVSAFERMSISLNQQSNSAEAELASGKLLVGVVKLLAIADKQGEYSDNCESRRGKHKNTAVEREALLLNYCAVHLNNCSIRVNTRKWVEINKIY